MPGLQCRHAWLKQGLRAKNDLARAEGWWVGSESHPLKESGKGRTHRERESIHHTYTSRASSFLDAFWQSQVLRSHHRAAVKQTMGCVLTHTYVHVPGGRHMRDLWLLLHTWYCGLWNFCYWSQKTSTEISADRFSGSLEQAVILPQPTACRAWLLRSWSGASVPAMKSSGQLCFPYETCLTPVLLG